MGYEFLGELGVFAGLFKKRNSESTYKGRPNHWAAYSFCSSERKHWGWRYRENGSQT
jgi:hypothetical protein